MTGTTGPNGTASYTYNGDGLNASAATTTGTSQYTWNTSSDLALMLSDTTNDYICGPTKQPVEQIALSTSSPTYLTYSASDSSWLTTNTAGDESGYWGYDAYGNLNFGTPTSSLGYAGQYLDQDHRIR